MSTALAAGAGLCWTLAYLLIIRTGLRERTYGMPVVAFCCNISWEFIYGFVRPSSGIQHVVNIVWFLLDCAIGYTVVRFGPEEFPYLPRRVFYGSLIVLLGFAYPALTWSAGSSTRGPGRTRRSG